RYCLTVAVTFARLGFAALSVFVSSRRRHTRWPRDWSSDVCSCDLAAEPAGARAERAAVRSARAPAGSAAARAASRPGCEAAQSRSEERRVGKESRDRTGTYSPERSKTSLQSVSGGISRCRAPVGHL